MDGIVKPLGVGDVIHGFAGGLFGRDHYDCVKIEAVGPDWVVARDGHGGLCFASGERDLLSLAEVRDEDACPEGDQCSAGHSVILTEFGRWHGRD